MPTDPRAILEPSVRCAPQDEPSRLPALVPALRSKVRDFRANAYDGATPTSIALLRWWFEREHLIDQYNGPARPFCFYFAQREAIETIVYLHDVAGVRRSADLMQFDGGFRLKEEQLAEGWPRFVVKMATGSGKTKVLGLALVWSFFCRTYEPDSELARNFLVITPNIIVLDRVYRDFQGLRMFFADPMVPDNGYEGRDWRNDFQLTVHKQDDVRCNRKAGNIFLTNVHRIHIGNQTPPSPDDEDTSAYFLGPRPTGRTTDSNVDLGMIVRDIDELMVLNDEAHHIHDEKLAWTGSIRDIHNRLKFRGGRLAMQVDVSATPRQNNGACFAHVVSDYPLVEAIRQRIVKSPVVPDQKSRDLLQERPVVSFVEKYREFLDLGVHEWRRTREDHHKLGRKPILFVMTDDTRNCDDVADYLRTAPELAGKDKVLVIHTKQNGDISEAASGKNEEELQKLRKQANEIDNFDSPAEAIVSVMMLKEGWDVRNVTTIVGLRAYSAKSNVLPEQTLGRGLRKMYGESDPENLSVIGTPAFLEFVESIRKEGVNFDHQPMGEQASPRVPLVIEVDRKNPRKDIDALDIEIPRLSGGYTTSAQSLDGIDAAAIPCKAMELQTFDEAEMKEIAFVPVVDALGGHTTDVGPSLVDNWRPIVQNLTERIAAECTMRAQAYQVYPLVEQFLRTRIFGQEVDLDDRNTLRNLVRLEILEATRKALTDFIRERSTVCLPEPRLESQPIRLCQMPPFIKPNQEFCVPRKSVFNKIVGDSGFELEFAVWLDGCHDVRWFAKNYLKIDFKIDYISFDKLIRSYYPDFIVRLQDDSVVIVETKGIVDVDVPLKRERLEQWCQRVNELLGVSRFSCLYVEMGEFNEHREKLTSFQMLQGLFP